MPQKIKDRTGIRYGRLVVIKFAGMDWIGNQLKSFWKCKCDCGKETIVQREYLQNGSTKSCGCLNREMTSKMCSKRIGKNNPNYIHGKDCGKNIKAIRELKRKSP